MKNLAAVLCLIFATCASAEDWVEIGTDNDSIHFVDRESLILAKDVVTLRKKVVYHAAQISAFTKNSQSIKYSIGTVEEDCGGHQHRVVFIELFSETGESIWVSGKMNRIWESVETDSVGASTQEFACRNVQ